VAAFLRGNLRVSFSFSIVFVIFSFEDEMDISTTIAALATLAIFSFLYKDNPFYKFAEHLLVGISVGYFVVVAWVNTVVPKLIQPLFYDGKLLYLIPGLLGLLMFMRLLPKVVIYPASRWL